jgi:hypothetical protein
MTENQKKTEFTDKDFMQAYGESAGIGGRFLLLFSIKLSSQPGVLVFLLTLPYGIKIGL